MDDRYDPSDFECNCDQLLDELLCDYVDGTMDPATRKAFEELVSRDQSVARYLEGLREAHSLLSNTGQCVCAPKQFHSKLRARLNSETGKMDIFGVEPKSSDANTAAGLLLIVLMVIWSGVVLPKHDATVQTAAVSQASLGNHLVAPANMTPAVPPIDAIDLPEFQPLITDDVLDGSGLGVVAAP